MRAHTKRARPRPDDGFGLIELIVALGVFMVVSVGLAYALMQVIVLGRDAHAREVAANIAAQEIDNVRSAEDVDAVVDTSYTVSDVGQETYLVDVATAWEGETVAGTCSTPIASPAYKRVTVSVTWQNQPSSTRPVISDALLEGSGGGLDPTKGGLVVAVLGGEDHGTPGVRVGLYTEGGFVVATQTTGSDGCAAFGNLAAGNYSVRLAAPGHVDVDGVAEPESPVTVAPRQTTSLQLRYDEGATLVVDLPHGFPTPEDVPLMLGNAELMPDGTTEVPGTGQVRTVGPVFPFAGGYTVWAGMCNDADPLGRDSEQRDAGSPYWPSSAGRETVLASRPAETSHGSVSLARVAVKASTAHDVVYAEHEAAPGCPDGRLLTLGTTNPGGRLAAALPWGTWRVYSSGSPAGTTVVLEPGTKGVTSVDLGPR